VVVVVIVGGIVDSLLQLVLLPLSAPIPPGSFPHRDPIEKRYMKGAAAHSQSGPLLPPLSTPADDDDDDDETEEKDYHYYRQQYCHWVYTKRPRTLLICLSVTIMTQSFIFRRTVGVERCRACCAVPHQSKDIVLVVWLGGNGGGPNGGARIDWLWSTARASQPAQFDHHDVAVPPQFRNLQTWRCRIVYR
jgi:hypothetical protein